MPKAVGGVQVSEAVFRKRIFQMFLTDSIYAASRKSLAALIDEQPIFECGHRLIPVFLHIADNQIGCSRPNLNDPEPVSLAENADTHFIRVEIVDTQAGDFVRSRAGIVQLRF